MAIDARYYVPPSVVDVCKGLDAEFEARISEFNERCSDIAEAPNNKIAERNKNHE